MPSAFDLSNIRKYRIFGISLFDLVTAFLGVLLIRDVLVGPGKAFRSTLQLIFAVIPFGVLLHLFLGQHTFLNRQIFETREFNGYKAFLIFSILMMFLT
jgi:hypothetical protein